MSNFLQNQQTFPHFLWDTLYMLQHKQCNTDQSTGSIFCVYGSHKLNV